MVQNSVYDIYIQLLVRGWREAIFVCVVACIYMRGLWETEKTGSVLSLWRRPRWLAEIISYRTKSLPCLTGASSQQGRTQVGRTRSREWPGHRGGHSEGKETRPVYYLGKEYLLKGSREQPFQKEEVWGGRTGCVCRGVMGRRPQRGEGKVRMSRRSRKGS